ncbi:MAG TPA: helix-turn-helix transcriptional regulator [Candidatus Dormibacteraeota bacterium]|nr:helix-turn-helix transcriptional regulator [Candidatus Dormibacteraeota bacterium]
MASGGPDAPDAQDAQPKRRRLPGINLRPGAVKQARADAGLSLAQLGKGHVTAPAIYLIETGRTRPSLPTLEHIARRTGKPVEFFLAEPVGAADDTQATLLELEALVADGRNDEAIVLGSSMLERGTSAFRLGRIRYFLAQAYAASGQGERASALLVEARAHFEAVDDGVMLADCIGAQASLASATQSKDALALAQKALEVCRALTPVPAPTEARLLGILAGVRAANREWDEAIATYRQAVEVGGSAYDLRNAARVYGALGLTYHETGQVEAAARYAMRSVALLEILRDRASLARAENSLAQILISRGDLEGARQLLDRALALTSSPDGESGHSGVLLSLAELAMQEGDVDGAAARAGEALAVAERLGEGGGVAEAHVWLGRIADRRDEPAEVDREFELAIKGFEAAGMRERLLQCHGIYAEILERRGELAKAYVHMKEALQASRPGLLRREQERLQEEERLSTA